MTRQNTQWAPWPDELEAAVADFHHEPGWEFSLHDIARDVTGDGEPLAGGLTLVIFVPCHDSYHPEVYRPVHHYHPVPAATFNRQSWERWIFDRLLDTIVHEAGEWARFGDGENARRPFAALHGPGDNPYVVHELATGEQLRTSFRGVVKPA